MRPEPISQQRISSQLGDDTIRQGSMSILISTVAILVFMVVYYRFCGIVADVAVTLNMVITVALMILIKAAFTLPGLAGLVLTVGMAVDANVLIYERMREETERGASLRMAIRNGYSRAMATIIDSHVTTLMSGRRAVHRRHRSDQRLRRHVDHRLADEPVHRGLRVAGDLRHRREEALADAVEHDAPDRPHRHRLHSLARAGDRRLGRVDRDRPDRGREHAAPELFDIDFTGGSSVQVLFAKDKPHDIAEVRKAVASICPTWP